MPGYTENNWLRRYGNTDLVPTFSSYHAQFDTRELAEKLRAAFSFLRRHADRRYSAQSLMKLLAAADRADSVLESGRPVDYSEFPMVALAETPFNYDPDTEVKTGGVVACAVILPDNRLMLATHAQERRTKLGRAMFGFVTNYMVPNPVVWAHQQNQAGSMFCLSVGMQPRIINNQGAVAYCSQVIRDNDDLTQGYSDDIELDEAVARHQRSQPRPRRREYAEGALRVSPRPAQGWLDVVDEVADPFALYDEAPERTYEESLCSDPGCNACRPYRLESHAERV